MAVLTYFRIFVFAENVGRLKKLEYLNLALNNIEVIENLEGDRLFQIFFFFIINLLPPVYILYLIYLILAVYWVWKCNKSFF